MTTPAPFTDSTTDELDSTDTSRCCPTGAGGEPARDVYTVAEVAQRLSLSLGGTYTLIRSGQIPARRMGGRWLIPKRRFHAWLDEQPTPPAAQPNTDPQMEDQTR